MKKAKITTGLVLLILLASLIQWPQATAITPQDQTISITDTHDDKFITETGIGIDSQLCHILDPTMDIRSFLVFRELEINYWEPLENATLRFRTTSILDFDADSSVTVYGMRYSDLQVEGILNPSWVLTVPVTSAHTTYNTSQFYGQTWHEIDVTSIVEELIRSYDWDGDGHAGTETGDAIGFILLGAEGHDTRWFIDYLYGSPSLAPQLVIHWNHEPPPPSSTAPPPYNDTDIWDWEYLNTSRGIDIYTVTSYGGPEFQAYSIDFPDFDSWYINSTKGYGNEIEWDEANYVHSDSGALDPILCLDPWVLILADKGNAGVYYTDDEFASYSYESPNPNYDDLSGHSGNVGSLAIDQLDKETIHLVYTSPKTDASGVYNVIYMNFTIDTIAGNLSWAPTYTNLTHGGTYYEPTLYCENDGTLHVVYWSTNEVWYNRRHINGTWFARVEVSDAGTGHASPDVIANEDTGDALIVWEKDSTDVYWDIVFPNNTDGPDRLANTGIRPAMVNDRENNIAQMVYGTATSQPALVRHQTKTVDNSSSWSAEMSVSPGGQKHFRPDIGIDPINGSLQAIWTNEWNEWVAGNFWLLGEAPTPGVTRITTSRGEHNYIEEEFTRLVVGSVYFASYPNGTLIDGPYDTLDDVILAIEDELGHDPQDPDPPGEEWEQTGAFTRFRMRLYYLGIGFGCLFGPILFFAWRRPSGYYLGAGFILMLIGLGMLLSIGQV